MFSMTGVGRAQAFLLGSQVTVEIKSFNHRYCDVSVRLPGRLSLFEIPIMSLVKEVLARGKVDVTIYEEKGLEKLSANSKALKEYVSFLQKLKKQFKIKEPLRLSDIQAGSSIWTRDVSDARLSWPVLKKLVLKALEDLKKMRKKEGAHLKELLGLRVKALKELHREVGTKRENVVYAYQQKLKTRIEKFLEAPVDPQRLAQEVALIADRADITEELERLTSHFKQLEELLEANEPVGRPLDFLIQELNREWNTIGSKSQDGAIGSCVLAAKAEIEKMREQVQNIE